MIMSPSKLTSETQSTTANTRATLFHVSLPSRNLHVRANPTETGAENMADLLDRLPETREEQLC